MPPPNVPMLPVIAGIASTRPQIFLYSLPMAVAAIAPWPLGLTGPIYGVAAAVLSTVFVVLAAAVLANRRRPSRREWSPRSGCSLFRSSICSLCSPRWSPTGGWSHEPASEDEVVRRQRERARLMAWLLGAFVILLFLITIAKIGLNR